MNFNKIADKCVTGHERKSACDVIDRQPLLGHEMKNSYDLSVNKFPRVGSGLCMRTILQLNVLKIRINFKMLG